MFFLNYVNFVFLSGVTLILSCEATLFIILQFNILTNVLDFEHH